MPFSGNAPVTLCDDTQLREVLLPLLPIGQVLARMPKQALQGLLGEALLAHVGQRLGINPMFRLPVGGHVQNYWTPFALCAT